MEGSIGVKLSNIIQYLLDFKSDLVMAWSRSIRNEELESDQEAGEPYVTLNVGGQIFSTTVTTLTRFPDTMLGAMFSGRYSLHKDKGGAVTIDRDGTHFRHILNFLRDPVNYRVDHLTEDDLIELRHQTEFFGLSDLMFPIQKEPENVLTRYGEIITITQSDDLLWRWPDFTVGTYCKKCKNMYGRSLDGRTYPVADFAKTHRIYKVQPTTDGIKCIMCNQKEMVFI